MENNFEMAKSKEKKYELTETVTRNCSLNKVYLK